MDSIEKMDSVITFHPVGSLIPTLSTAHLVFPISGSNSKAACEKFKKEANTVRSAIDRIDARQPLMKKLDKQVSEICNFDPFINEKVPELIASQTGGPLSAPPGNIRKKRIAPVAAKLAIFAAKKALVYGKPRLLQILKSIIAKKAAPAILKKVGKHALLAGIVGTLLPALMPSTTTSQTCEIRDKLVRHFRHHNYHGGRAEMFEALQGLSTVYDGYLDDVRKAKAAALAAAAGKISPFILNADSISNFRHILRYLARQHNLHAPQLSFAFLAALPTSLVYHKGNAFIILHVPLSSFPTPLELQRYHDSPITISSRDSNSSAVIVPNPENTLLATHKGDAFIELSDSNLERCTKVTETYICLNVHTYVLNPRKSCTSGLFLSNFDAISNNCRATIPSGLTITQIATNSYAVFCPKPLDYSFSCETGSRPSGVLDGLFKITLPEACDLIVGNIRLQFQPDEHLSMIPTFTKFPNTSTNSWHSMPISWIAKHQKSALLPTSDESAWLSTYISTNSSGKTGEKASSASTALVLIVVVFTLFGFVIFYVLYLTNKRAIVKLTTEQATQLAQVAQNDPTQDPAELVANIARKRARFDLSSLQRARRFIRHSGVPRIQQPQAQNPDTPMVEMGEMNPNSVAVRTIARLSEARVPFPPESQHPFPVPPSPGDDGPTPRPRNRPSPHHGDLYENA